MNCDNNHRNEEFIVTFDKGNKQDNSRRKHDNFPIRGRILRRAGDTLYHK